MATFASLYADGAFWQQNPFRDPEPDYLVRVSDEERSADCAFGAPIVDGDRAAVRWSAKTKLVDGGSEDLAGVSFLRFDAGGLVVEHRDFGVEIAYRGRVSVRAHSRSSNWSTSWHRSHAA